MKNQEHIVISEGRPPLLKLLLSTLAFSLSIFFLLLFFTGYNMLRPEYEYEKFQVSPLYMAIVLAGIGVLLAKNNSILIDRKLGRIKSQWQLGMFGFGQWKKLSPVAYVSVFKAHKSYSVNFNTRAPVRYEVNLWLKKGGRKRVYFNYNATVSLQMGKEIARFLKVDLWDATNPHEQKKVTL
ncbi:hypothetical protein [Croceitalea dokdonensis]|nr:hypothetical protein [Croceitalea dokdonensis]